MCARVTEIIPEAAAAVDRAEPSTPALRDSSVVGGGPGGNSVHVSSSEGPAACEGGKHGEAGAAVPLLAGASLSTPAEAASQGLRRRQRQEGFQKVV